MPKYYEEKEKDERSCAGVREDLRSCLLESFCVIQEKKTVKQCLKEGNCRSLLVLFFECKRSLKGNFQPWKDSFSSWKSSFESNLLPPRHRKLHKRAEPCPSASGLWTHLSLEVPSARLGLGRGLQWRQLSCRGPSRRSGGSRRRSRSGLWRHSRRSVCAFGCRGCGGCGSCPGVWGAAAAAGRRGCSVSPGRRREGRSASAQHGLRGSVKQSGAHLDPPAAARWGNKSGFKKCHITSKRITALHADILRTASKVL